MKKWRKSKQQPQSPPALQHSLSAPDVQPSGSGSSSSSTEQVPIETRRSSNTTGLFGDSTQPRAVRHRSGDSDATLFDDAHPWSPGQDQRDDPLGLTTLYAPTSEQRTVDIMFIHGLGGTSLRTWCMNRELEYLWPRLWLPLESDLSTARIMSFGYGAQLFDKRGHTFMTIGDFANDLLFRMKYGDHDSNKIGEVPIIIVAHSMGGLIFKKAFVQGFLNEEFRKITSSIKAVLFLATPHRGTELAGTLNRVLLSSPFGHSSKQYVAELTKNSPTLDELNESFRHHSSKLQIFSFYETLATSIGPMNVMILEKHTSVLGYQNETPQPLFADHHNVCKFTGRGDPNYKSVVGALRNVVNMLKSSEANVTATEQELGRAQSWLGVTAPPEDEMATLRSIKRAGTCEQVLERPEFATWRDSQVPHILWAYGAPGSGKSCQCFSVIDSFRRSRATCSYWFFRHGDPPKRSLTHALRSLASQMATQDAGFRRTLATQADLGISINKADAPTIWKAVFEPSLASLSCDHYWVIDALDESESIKSFFDLISNLGSVIHIHNIRVLTFSRPLSTIIQSVQRVKKKIRTTEMPSIDNLKDIRLVVSDEMEYLMSTDEEFKQDITDEIVARSQGNFLWAALVLKEVLQCHRQEDVKRVLRAVPDGMEKLYHRMADTIINLDYDRDKNLCKIILSWAMYSSRSVGLDELMEPYSAELRTIMNVKHTIGQICGQFVVINTNNQVVLVHETAREYLRTSTKLPFSLDPCEIHEDLLSQCLTALCDPTLQMKIQQRKMSRFLPYAAVSWGYHLARAAVESDKILESLVNFFTGSFPLPWIQFLASSGKLSGLITISSSLSKYVRQLKRLDDVKPPALRRLFEISLLERWASDLVNVAAKFGRYLVDDPKTIYKHIPALSPKNSAIHQQYANKLSTTIYVSGLSTIEWDDCLARVSNGDHALHIAVSPQHLAVANDSPNGNIQLWNSNLFQKYGELRPMEPICHISFSKSGSLLVCYGLDHSYVWQVSDQSIVAKVASPHRERAMAMEFGPHEDFIMLATNLRRVYRLNLNLSSLEWTPLADSLLEETSLPEGAFINSPSSVAFNSDCTQLAVAYRGFPLAVWNLEPPEMVARCKRKRKQGQTTNDNAWTGVNRVTWHPFNTEVLGIYRDGQIFKWSPVDGGHEEVKQELDATPSEVTCSRHGHVFATSDVRGSVKIYDYLQMVLIYKLTSDDLIRAIAFSPDSRRFFDLRGSYCNVWEPSCLIRILDTDLDSNEDLESVTTSQSGTSGDMSSVSENGNKSSIASVAAEADADSDPAITAVEICAGKPKAFLYARENGTIELYHPDAQALHIVTQSTFGNSVGHLTLSPKGDYVAYSSLSGRITVKRIDYSSESNGVTFTTVLTEKNHPNRGILRQILLHPDSQRVLICTTEQLQVLDMTTGNITAQRMLDETESLAQWDSHPDDPGAILAYTTHSVSALDWYGLESRYSIQIGNLEMTENLQLKPTPTVRRLLPSYHPRMRLLTTRVEEGGSEISGFLLLDITPLREENSPSAKSSTLKSIPITARVAHRIKQPVGLLRDGRLVFLDQDLWVCTFQPQPTLSPEVNTVPTRHFFIPRDWLDSAGLLMCRIQADGAFLCPSKRNMISIGSEISAEW